MSDKAEKEYLGIKELAAAVADSTEGGTRYRGRGNASEVPNERTLKYYLSENLLPVPDRKRGVSLVFGKKHLLIVLAIKKLQQLGLATNVIRDALAGKTEDELEQIVNEDVTVKLVDEPEAMFSPQGLAADESDVDVGETFRETTQKIEIGPERSAAVNYFDDSLRTARNEGAEWQAPPQVALRSASPEESLLPKQAEASGGFFRSSAPAPLAAAHPAASDQTSSSWKRYDIEPGLELHIRSDYKPPAGFLAWRRLVQKIKAIIHV